MPYTTDMNTYHPEALRDGKAFDALDKALAAVQELGAIIDDAGAEFGTRDSAQLAQEVRNAESRLRLASSHLSTCAS